MHTVIISTGSNLENRQANIESARSLIEERIGSIRSFSAIYESRSWGYRSENLFYNQCLAAETKFGAGECLVKILEIEDLLGRERGKISNPDQIREAQDFQRSNGEGGGYVDRIIDIDILFYDDLILNSSPLIIPHEKLADRRFVLLPLAEILPELLHPVLHKTIRELLEQCPDTIKVYTVQLP